MKRRKKPQGSALARERDGCELSGLYPYLIRFLEWSASRGYTRQTTASRADHLKRFIRWCAERSIERPQDVTRPILERYRRYLYHYRKEGGEPLSFATQQQRLLPLRVFFKYLARENLILANPASELELPRAHRRLPAHLLSREDIDHVIAQTVVHGVFGIRDQAILETLYSTGIRRSELVALKLYELDLKNGMSRRLNDFEIASDKSSHPIVRSKLSRHRCRRRAVTRAVTRAAHGIISALRFCAGPGSV
ncbi:MAG TPA: hypothetical protein VIY90_09890 [Steroidobacteraceae bacterium]